MWASTHCEEFIEIDAEQKLGQMGWNLVAFNAGQNFEQKWWVLFKHLKNMEMNL